MLEISWVVAHYEIIVNRLGSLCSYLASLSELTLVLQLATKYTVLYDPEIAVTNIL